MSNYETLTAALLAAFNLDADKAEPAAVAGAAATVLLAFADAVRGPAPVNAEVAFSQLVAGETPALILAELRKQNTLLEVIAKQGDQAATERQRLARSYRSYGVAGPVVGAGGSGLSG